MKLVDAFWEKKNLNKTTLEIIFEHGDDISDICKIIDNEEYDYIVAKVPIIEPNLLEGLHNIGFIFCETQLSLFNNLKKSLSIDSTFVKMGEKLKINQVQCEEELYEVLNNVDNEMFSTDRIALDHIFGKEVSNSRYKNWINDEFHNNKTIEILNIIKDNKTVGFFMTELKDDETVQVLLGGIYSKYQGMGLGYSIISKPIERYTSTGRTIIRTKVSSNNLEVIKLYISMNYQIENVEYIFIRHKEPFLS